LKACEEVPWLTGAAAGSPAAWEMCFVAKVVRLGCLPVRNSYCAQLALFLFLEPIRHHRNLSLNRTSGAAKRGFDDCAYCPINIPMFACNCQIMSTSARSAPPFNAQPARFEPSRIFHGLTDGSRALIMLAVRPLTGHLDCAIQSGRFRTEQGAAVRDKGDGVTARVALGRSNPYT
jgi:hypothetical protein